MLWDSVTGLRIYTESWTTPPELGRLNIIYLFAPSDGKDRNLEPTVPSSRLTWQWNIDPLKMYFLLNMGIFIAMLVYQSLLSFFESLLLLNFVCVCVGSKMGDFPWDAFFFGRETNKQQISQGPAPWEWSFQTPGYLMGESYHII